MKLFKRLAAALLMVCMVISLLPSMALPASAADYAAAEAGVYELVTSPSQLAAGDQIILVNTSAKKAMSTTQNSNNRAATDVTISDGTITLGAGNSVQLITLETGSQEDTFRLNTGAGYLYAASSNANHLKTTTSPDKNANFKIALGAESGKTTLVAQGTNTRNNLRYNSNLFACYKSGQDPVDIYRLKADATVTSYTVTYYDRGEKHSEASVIENTAIGTLPTIVNIPSGWAFMGWAGTQYPTPQDTAPELYTGKEIVKADLDLYAVYAAETPSDNVKLKLKDQEVYVGARETGKNYLSAVNTEAEAAAFRLIEAGQNNGKTAYYIFDVTDGVYIAFASGTSMSFSAQRVESDDSYWWEFDSNEGSFLNVKAKDRYLGYNKRFSTYTNTYSHGFDILPAYTYSNYTTAPEAVAVTYTVTTAVEPENSGTITSAPETLTGLAAGAEVMLEATPVTGYRFVRWEITGVEAETAGNMASFTVNANVMAKAVFEKITYSIELIEATNGTIAVEGGKTTAQYGDTITLVATPDENYVLDMWTVLDGNGDDVAVSGNQFTMPASDVLVSASFRRKSIVLEDINLGVDYDRAVTIDVLKNVTPAEGVTAQIALEDGAQEKGFSLSADGKMVSYAPVGFLSAPVTCDYTVTVGTETETATITVTPEAEMFYEESNAAIGYTGAWSETGNGTVTQQDAAPGTVGYDSHYANSATYSDGKAKTVTVSEGETAAASFSFTGTGVDVFATTSSATGAFLLEVTDANGAAVEKKIISAYRGFRYEDGTWVPEEGDACYQVPVVSVTGLAYGEYNVKLTVFYSAMFDVLHKKSYSFTLDAVRVYDPMGTGALHYTSLRQSILAAMTFGSENASPCAAHTPGTWERGTCAVWHPSAALNAMGTLMKKCSTCGNVVQTLPYYVKLDERLALSTGGSAALSYEVQAGTNGAAPDEDAGALLGGLTATWASSDETVARVDGNKVTGLASGTAILTLKLTDEDGTVWAQGLRVSVSVQTGYTLVTDAKQLTTGSRVIIVAKDSNYAMSTNQKSNNRGQIAIIKNGNSIAAVEDLAEFTLQTGKKENTYSFYTGSGYLYAASSSKNYLRTEDTLSDNSSWTISIAADGTATVKAQGESTHNWMRYNKSDSLFSCYASGQQDICLYILPTAASSEANAARRDGAGESDYGFGFIDGGKAYDLEAFEKNGPKNEVYLANGQAVVFYLEDGSDGTKVQIGAKALNASAPTLSVTALNGTARAELLTQKLNTSTEMYYEIGAGLGWNGTTSGVILLANTGEGVLSITNVRSDRAVKLCINQQAAALAGQTLRQLLDGTLVYGAEAFVTVAPKEPAPGLTADGFTDVSSSVWYYDAVCYVVEQGLMNGVSKTEFEPEETLTRAMLVTVLYRLAGAPEVEQTGCFTDVPAERWYADAVAWAFQTGITTGATETTFEPDEPVTREQMVTFFWRYAGKPAAGAELKDFPDADEVDAYAAEAFAWAVENGIVKGDLGKDRVLRLLPLGKATRAELATIFMRSADVLQQD